MMREGNLRFSDIPFFAKVPLTQKYNLYDFIIEIKLKISIVKNSPKVKCIAKIFTKLSPTKITTFTVIHEVALSFILAFLIENIFKRDWNNFGDCYWYL